MEKYLVCYSHEYFGDKGWLSVARVYDAEVCKGKMNLACGEYLQDEKPTSCGEVDIVYDLTQEAKMADIRADLPF